MNIFRRFNPFRRRYCCQVPLIAGTGDIEAPRSVVTGLAEVDGLLIEWVGIVLEPDTEDPHITDALEVAERVLSERMRVSEA